ncbi:MAG TPA: DUF4249 family protein [Phaeodactylibacter sp.]|nr:DUF4249 family protein [Phaeodactylibacter sp.]
MRQLVTTMIFFFMLFFFLSCEREISLDISDEQKLVLLSNFNPDSSFRLTLSTTIPITRALGQEPAYPNNAQIQLFEDGNSCGDFVYDQGDAVRSPFYYLDKKPEVGKDYMIKISVEDFPDISANNQVPPAVGIGAFSLIDSMHLQEDNPDLFFYVFRALLQVDRPVVDSLQYFHITAFRMVREFTIVGNDTLWTMHKKSLALEAPVSEDIRTIFHEKGFLLKGSYFDSHQDKIALELSFFHNRAKETGGTVYLALRHVSKDYFLFHQSIGEQEVQGASENILSTEAYFIYNNVQGGIGNFGAYHEVLDSLKY